MIIYRFSARELEQIHQWTTERDSSHHRQQNTKIDPRRDDFETNLLGMKGEYASWRLIGGEWIRYSVDRKDPGWELLKAGMKIQIKTNNYADGDFYVRPWQKMKADIGILVTRGPGIHVTLVGGISRERFLQLAEKKTYGRAVDKPVDAVRQGLLTDIRHYMPASADRILSKMIACTDDDDELPYEWDPDDDMGGLRPPGELTGEVYED